MSHYANLVIYHLDFQRSFVWKTDLESDPQQYPISKIPTSHNHEVRVLVFVDDLVQVTEIS